jgi:hypothetical protein
MHSRPFLLGLVPALALALCACAGESGGDPAKGSDAIQDEAQYEGQFPAQADLIDDIRGAIAGEGAATGTSTIPRHGDPPLFLGNTRGPYWVDSYDIDTGLVYYPTNAPAPFAGLALCGGFLNSGPEMTDWGEFYASWGIVTVITWTGLFDLPTFRAWALTDAVEELKGENTSPLSPLYGKMSDRYGTSGYSMGGGGTTIAAQGDSTHKVSIGMAPWAPVGSRVEVPTLMMCGDIDIVADCSDSEWAYDDMSESVPKMWVMLSGGVGHLDWFGPGAAWGKGGAYGLAFAKLFLEGDERWKATLLGLGGGFVTTNIR